MASPDPIRACCPYCRKQIVQRSSFFPFCSPRCKMADLQRWFSGANVISQDLDSLTPDQRQELDELEATDASTEEKK